jgi:Rod binding domain-containing protein
MNVAAISSASFAENPERISKLPTADQAKAAAGQFEAIIIRQMLQDSVGKIMQPSSGDSGGGIYGYMLTDMLASKIAEGGGLGLGQIISRQLTPHAPTAEGKDHS